MSWSQPLIRDFPLLLARGALRTHMHRRRTGTPETAIGEQSHLHCEKALPYRAEKSLRICLEVQGRAWAQEGLWQGTKKRAGFLPTSKAKSARRGLWGRVRMGSIAHLRMESTSLSR